MSDQRWAAAPALLFVFLLALAAGLDLRLAAVTSVEGLYAVADSRLVPLTLFGSAAAAYLDQAAPGAWCRIAWQAVPAIDWAFVMTAALGYAFWPAARRLYNRVFQGAGIAMLVVIFKLLALGSIVKAPTADQALGLVRILSWASLAVEAALMAVVTKLTLDYGHQVTHGRKDGL